jgi:8-oxo-dGTP pyrophosphatase MutT (NUDIX family)
MSEPKHSSHFPDCFYRVTVKGLYVKDGKVLFTRDITNPQRKELGGDLELPGGGLDFGEDMKDALRREVREEMGLEIANISDQPVYVWTANHGPGRTIDWYYVCVVVFNIELKNLDFIPSDECQELIFLSPDEMRVRMPEMAVQIQPLVNVFKLEDTA